MPRTRTATIFHGDDFDTLTDLKMTLALAEERASDSRALRSMSADELPDVEGAREAYRLALDAALERSTDVVVHDIGSRRWRDLVAAHPPRKGHQYDDVFGYNTDTFPEALLKFDDGERRSIESPAFGKASERNEWLDDMPPADFETIMTKALEANRGQGADPKDVLPLSDSTT